MGDRQSKDLTAGKFGQAFNDEKGCMVFKVTEFEGLPARWSLVAGDALYNFRAALEYLAWHLVRAGMEPQPKNPRAVQFPIFTDKEVFDKSIKTRLPGVKPAHLEIVEKYQPYIGGQKTSPHPLSVLVELSNTDNTTKSKVPLSGITRVDLTFIGASDFEYEQRLEYPDPILTMVPADAKEIYEGDILRRFGWYEPRESLEVHWDDDIGGFAVAGKLITPLLWRNILQSRKFTRTLTF